MSRLKSPSYTIPSQPRLNVMIGREIITVIKTNKPMPVCPAKDEEYNHRQKETHDKNGPMAVRIDGVRRWLGSNHIFQVILSGISCGCHLFSN